ncbi:MAG: DUF350 domain-containing protein [Pseudanabaena sp. M158S2SP1A06QC]|jgi:uncharacterized membrane protein YjfL (UPF0719 family)|uniref:DUF350 domain-containing protein n=1 Tax=Pseudanabaena mucicola TaxID=71190 RepID=UPI002576980D|nr:DUF350 domain-containing protein [Pseudanabaena mucicola]MCA6583787.1 DUF350 domain-containing protein [Pseudanabaena sp. M34BS1SP1A06MG]MCA6597452.1 DUF350 domain-containing protein [Pseudanabaena sp. M046S1SP1A06QC]MCA6599661.1 DUF350 domain-containing protein [Pseudanabaena sp. M57BS1SP1A06MG]MCA6612232.1 DUF350 domain-containing protein [Pseudanabaena sp. M158S2SP1A06QC]
MERVLQEIGRSPLIIAEIIVSFILFWIGQFVYQRFFRRKLELNVELFVRDNSAVAVALVGYYLGIAIALKSALTKSVLGWQNVVVNLVLYGILVIGLMWVGAVVCDRLILQRCDSAREILEERNFGAAALESGCHIANGIIISSAMGGDSGTWLVGLVSYAIGLATLVMASFCYSVIAGYRVFKAIQEHNNPAAGVAFAGMLVAIGNVVHFAFLPEFENWGISFILYGLSIPFGILMLIAIRWIADLILVPGVKISDEIVRQEVPNLGAGLIEAFAYIAGSLLIVWSI